MVRVQLDMADKITSHIDPSIQGQYKHLHGQLSKLYFYADDLSENIQALVNLQVSLASQTTNESSFKINEVTRLLTLFSVYFLPLNFIAGIYGMNFKFMPELESKFGYPFVLLVMCFTALCLYWWTKKKGWL
jgi:magnesium transporter